MARRIQREVVLPLAWAPAILLQLAHPLVARGVADHSTFRDRGEGPVRRLRRTLDAMLRLCFGTREEAWEAARRVNAIHDRVHGSLPRAAGAFAAGSTYSAHDPALLAWVHATLVDTSLRTYELFVVPLCLQEKDRYCAEASAIAVYLGIPPGYLARSYRELRRYVDATLAGDTIAVSEVARTLAREVLRPDLHPVATPLLGLVRLTALGLLPPRLRDDYGFAWSARDQARLAGVARLVRALLPLTPPFLRYWPAAASHAPPRRSQPAS